MTSSEDPDLIAYINAGDKWLTELVEEEAKLKDLLTELESWPWN